MLRVQDLGEQFRCMNNRLGSLTLGIVDGFQNGAMVTGHPRFIGILEGEGSNDSSSGTNKGGEIRSSFTTGLVLIHEDDDPLEAKDPTELIGAGLLG